MITRKSFKDMTQEEWLAQRRKSIGGSDAGAVVGLNNYVSPYSLWAEKTGKLPYKDISDKEAVRLGKDLEEYVAQRFSEATGKKVRRDNHFVYNSLYPFAHVQVDRLVVGEDAILECKTTSSWEILKACRDGKYPDSWYVQTVHEMAITGAKKAYLAVLCFGHGFFWFEIERDQAEIDALMAAEGSFWRDYVEKDAPPPADGAEATAEALETIWAGSRADSIPLFGRDALLREYMDLAEQEKAVKKRRTEISNIIKADMMDAQRASCDGFRVSWAPQTRRLFQIDDFQEAYPDIDLTPFFKDSASRPFKVTAEAN